MHQSWKWRVTFRIGFCAPLWRSVTNRCVYYSELRLQRKEAITSRKYRLQRNFTCIHMGLNFEITCNLKLQVLSFESLLLPSQQNSFVLLL